MKSQDSLYKYLMSEALKQAQKAFDAGEVPVGAVVAVGSEIVAAERNRMEELNDATAHAEILALRSASTLNESWRLEDMTICVTLEPCTMCIGAVFNSRISTVIFGAWDKRAGACGSIYDLTSSYPGLAPKQVIGGIEEASCVSILKDFFGRVRRHENSPLFSLESH